MWPSSLLLTDTLSRESIELLQSTPNQSCTPAIGRKDGHVERHKVREIDGTKVVG